MRRPPLMLAGLWLLAACASAPAPEPAPALPEALRGPTETYGPPIEEAATALVAAEPDGAVPRGLEVRILSVEETAAGLFYTAELHAPGRRRSQRDYVIYGQCAAADLTVCAGQIVSAARMLVGGD